MSSDNDQTVPVQVRYVQAPSHYSPNVAWLGVSMGIVIAGLFCGIGATYFVSRLGLDYDDWLVILFYYVLAISVGGGLWGAYRHHPQWTEESGKTPGSRLRHRRLKLLARRNRLVQRKPRLALQWALLKQFRFNGEVWRISATDRAVITVATGFPPGFPRPVPQHAAFEPIPIDEPGEQMLGLLEMTVAACGMALPGQVVPPELSGRARAAQNWRRKPKPRDLVRHIYVIGMASYAYWLIAPRFPWIFFIPLLLPLAILYGPWLVDPRRWWLVPGGIVYREARSWRKRMRVGMVTPENSPLFVHYEEGYALVRVNTMTLRIVCPDWSGWCVLAAWISTAPRPTKEEILAFFGPDAVWEGS